MIIAYISLIMHKAGVHSLGMRLGSPKMIITVQCSICSQLSNKGKPRVVVAFFKLHIPAVYGFTH